MSSFVMTILLGIRLRTKRKESQSLKAFLKQQGKCFWSRINMMQFGKTSSLPQRCGNDVLGQTATPKHQANGGQKTHAKCCDNERYHRVEYLHYRNNCINSSVPVSRGEPVIGLNRR